MLNYEQTVEEMKEKSGHVKQKITLVQLKILVIQPGPCRPGGKGGRVPLRPRQERVGTPAGITHNNLLQGARRAAARRRRGR
ncbi:hypothetical protein J6590_076895 [Homalodisca vitripennis]|nr:hypothetical protein J6590_076895 [Homalodisca vitripennis]